jgi:hypothetical protein
VIFLMATFWPEGLWMAELQRNLLVRPLVGYLTDGSKTYQTTP